MASDYPFWLGGVAASMSAGCTHPLDVTKVRMQILGSNHLSTLSIIRNSITQFGFGSLYAGLSASLLRQMSYSLVRLGSYEKIKAKLSRDGKLSSAHILLAACFAGGLGGLVGNPADIMVVRMTSDLIRPPEKRYNYSNALAGLVHLIRDEGVHGLARGLGTNSFRAILMNASQVGSYDFFKTSLLSQALPINWQFEDALPVHLVSSCAAGLFATTICSPADVVRSRVMAASYDTNFGKVLKKSLQEEGIRFLFKGWTPAFMRLGPNTVLMFVFYEQLKQAWKEHL